jgi:choline dehydrogenase-like flavoprotein
MHFDAIIVGSGATGTWAAKLLTERALRVLLLEAGPPVEQVETRRNFPGCADTRQIIQSHCYAFNADTRHLFVDDVDNPYETPPGKPFIWIRMRLVGGRTVLWHRIALRMSDRQFKSASLDGFGVDWPIRYSDLKVHYDAVESYLGVCGVAADRAEIPGGPFLSASLSESAHTIKQGVENTWRNRHVTPLRRARASWSVGATLAAAEATTRLTLRSHSVVSRVICNRNGTRALGVEYLNSRSGATHEALGKVIILCASTIETTRILLNSASPQHPDGLGNSNGLLGRYLTEHTSGVKVTGVRRGECASHSDFYIPNFRNRDGDKESFLRGYGIQGYIGPASDKVTQCELACFGEMLPRSTNRVTLANVRDRWGIPVPRVECQFSDNELEMARDQMRQSAEILRCAGFDVERVQGLGSPGGSIHEVGTARMGSDPATSILDPYNRCWGVRNLFVTDGAAFPSAGFQNPTLTMMALTGRACGYIVEELAHYVD